MKLYLIRHAQSANNAVATRDGDEAGRVPDPDITETGHRQARLLAAHLALPEGETQQHPLVETVASSFGITHLYCSLMTRSVMTAQYVAEALDLTTVAHPDIFERGGIYQPGGDGAEEGLPGPGKDYFRERFPELALPESLDEQGWYNRPYETEPVFVSRVAKALADIKARHIDSDDRVAMVVHGDFIDQFVNEVTGVARREENYRSHWVANWAFHNTSITRIDFVSDAQVIVYVNRLNHIPSALVTW